MNVSYLSRLRDAIADGRKNADPPLEHNCLVVVRVQCMPILDKNDRISTNEIESILTHRGWNAFGVMTPPDFVYLGRNNELHFLFQELPESQTLHVLISITSSICTYFLKNKKIDCCVCTGSKLTNIAEVFAYFVLEEDSYCRKEAKTILETEAEHLSIAELRELFTAKGKGEWKLPPAGIFYRLTKAEQRPLRGWKTTKLPNMVRLQKHISFNKFEEHLEMIFGP